MSLENNLERIANALEALVAQGATTAGASLKAPKPAASKSKAAASTVDASTSTTPNIPTPPPAPPVAEPTAPPAVPSTTETPVEEGPAVSSPEELNKLLVQEYNRLGGKPETMQRILGVMEHNYGVRSVNDLTKEQYGPLITLIRAL